MIIRVSCHRCTGPSHVINWRVLMIHQTGATLTSSLCASSQLNRKVAFRFAPIHTTHCFFIIIIYLINVGSEYAPTYYDHLSIDASIDRSIGGNLHDQFSIQVHQEAYQHFLGELPNRNLVFLFAIIRQLSI